MKRKAQRAALVAAITGLVLSFAALAPQQVAADSRWGANYFPDVTLTTQDGDDVKFYDLIKGRIVAIDLIYTNCQYACPLESARLARMQQILGDRMGKDVFFISISIDPEHDTPAALKAYAAKYDAGPGWFFLTGKMSDIDVLSKKLGLWSDPTLTQDGHTPMLLIGNEAAGQWTQTSALDNPVYTAKMIGNWMNGFRSTVGNSTTESKPIVNRDNGRYLYGSLCANCHTIGRGDKIGPDLAVSLDTRQRDWLARYTFQPDVMRIKNDPIAMALMKKFGEVRMPNLGLEAEEVKSILRYVETEKSSAPSATEVPMAAHATPATATGAGSSALVEPAIAIQVALAGDTLVGVAAQAAAVRQAAAALGPSGTALETAAAELANETSIVDARKAFGTMSDALIQYLENAKAPLAAGVRVAYCPMARKSWLQMDGALANPYYGSKMLGCGEFTKLTH